MAARKPQRVKPLHQRILGKSQEELDLIEDLTDELERAYSLDLIEYDDYLRCHDALAVRKAKAQRTLDKLTNSHNAPPTVEYRRAKAKPRPLSPIQVKFLMLLTALIFFNLFAK